MNWLKERGPYVVGLVASLASVASAFGVQLTAEQTSAVTTAAAMLISVIVGRKVTKA